MAYGLIYGCNMKRYSRMLGGLKYRVPLNRLGYSSEPKHIAECLRGQRSIWIRKGADRL